MPQKGARRTDKGLHRVYRTVCTICMFQSDTWVSAWLIQTAQTVRSNLHSTLCLSTTRPFVAGPGVGGREGILPPVEALAEPVEEANEPAGEDAVEDDGAGDGEDFAADAEDLAFFFVFDGGGGYAVSKAGDGDEGAGAAPFGNGGVDVESGQEDA